MSRIFIKFKPRGQTFVEFLIISPLFLIICLFSAQFMFFVDAHHGVQLAAFNAARSFAVNINNLSLEKALKKMESSAVMSLIGYVPSVSESGLFYKDGSLVDFSKLALFAAKKGIDVFSLKKKYSYALRFTKTYIDSPKDPSLIRRGTPFTVKVDFLFKPQVPIVDGLFSSAFRLAGYRTYDPFYNLFKNKFISGKNADFLKISKSATMQSEY